jgi:hypothetical protein
LILLTTENRHRGGRPAAILSTRGEGMKSFLHVSVMGLVLAFASQTARGHEGEDHGSHGDHGAASAEKTTAKIEEHLSKLSPEDQALAEAQKFCPIMPEVRLGEMGPVIKVMAGDQPVFVCCKGCQKKALASPEKTLAAAQSLKEKVAAEAEVQASLVELSPEDRELAAAQGFCAIATKSRLGGMGAPIKVLVNNQPVFVCCKGCSKKALAEPEKTLAAVETLKAKVAESKDIEASFAAMNPGDRGAAREQGYCPVMADNLLGTMGAPIKIMVKGQPVYLCCKGCQRRAMANPEKTLAAVTALRKKVAAASAE